MTQKRNWCFTINNYTDIEVNTLKNLKCEYIVFGYEIGEKGTPHLQGYMEFKGGKRFDTIKKTLPRAWLGSRKGTSMQAYKYCIKDGNFFERGRRSRGRKNKLEAQVERYLRIIKEERDRKIVNLEKLIYECKSQMNRCSCRVTCYQCCVAEVYLPDYYEELDTLLYEI